jgi:hypothetical protein
MSTADAIASIGWADLELISIGWIETGRDLILRVRVAGPLPKQERFVIFRWASQVAINISGLGGCPLTWDVTFERRPDDTWSVLFDLAGSGEMRLICNDVEVCEPGKLNHPAEW